jgi:hypothetical protein
MIMEYFDNIGNKIEVGDEVLILVPKSDKTYRRGTVKDFKNAFSHGVDHFHCDVLVEYDDGRLYCNEYKWNQHQDHNIKFSKKITKAWRSNSDIVKLKQEYIQ